MLDFLWDVSNFLRVYPTVRRDFDFFILFVALCYSEAIQTKGFLSGPVCVMWVCSICWRLARS